MAIQLVYNPATGVHEVPGAQKLLGAGGRMTVREGGGALAVRGSSALAKIGQSAARGSMLGAIGKAIGKGAKALGPLGTALELAFVPAIAIGSTIRGSAQWGAPSGLEEDYVGGAVYGGARGLGAGFGAAGGGITGTILGGAIGSIGGPIGTAIGAVVGGITGSVIGESVGGRMLNGPARQLGLGARALVRTSRAVDRAQFGGGFVDTRGAYTMRQRAVQDMSSSMLNARQFLGNEAIFLHER